MGQLFPALWSVGAELAATRRRTLGVSLFPVWEHSKILPSARTHPRRRLWTRLVDNVFIIDGLFNRRHR